MQRTRQELHARLMRSAAQTAFERADRGGTQIRSLRQLFLRETGGEAMPPQQLAERHTPVFDVTNGDPIFA